ncbi:hypothetical protein TGAM01_v200236 [Trichoderma gamsii]|uniref:Mtf2-like C-terminal domain-containing protein n=1 Tax=Trichoderma gamsii TaxID=398673 RepID=A0A2P5A2Q8_9HYPO|nr:hypothetical protein TGAM01_v200236 [Trichoderma gamsii]PON30815.1 hypothetical protein TGAM01_v200236 [Trichoderma gamsii]
MLPFLYQTRTLQRAVKGPLVALTSARLMHSPRRPKKLRDNSIPFQWDSKEDQELEGPSSEQASTITPSEAQIFKKIFSEIAEGKMPPVKSRTPAQQNLTDAPAISGERDSSGSARAMTEKVRISEFREKFLGRYPKSLQNAAQVALGLYEVKPQDSESGEKAQMIELDGADEATWAERTERELARSQECERVESLMKQCKTDAELWSIMEKEVFSLPEKLHIAQAKRAAKGKKKARQSNALVEDAEASLYQEQSALEMASQDEERVMDIHGPLYSRFLSTALDLFNSAFARPSPYIFQILPRIKELGLPSFVLGVSTPFYSKLAEIHWQRFGDANSALDMLEEMNSAGLFANKEANGLLSQLRNHLHACTWGGQGPFVMAMMESSEFGNALIQRIEFIEKMIEQSSHDRLRDPSF